MIGAIVGAVAQRRSGQDAANATRDAARMSSEAELTATREAIAAQERATNQARQDNSTWMHPADRGLATLQSLIYGGPVSYRQRSYTEGMAPRPVAPTAVAPPVGERPANTVGQNPDGSYSVGYGSDEAYQIQHTNSPDGASAEWDKQFADYQKYMSDMQDYANKEAQWQASQQGGNVGAETETVTAQQFELPPNFDGTKYAFDGSKYAFDGSKYDFKFDPSQIDSDPGYAWEKKRGLEDLRTQLMLSGRPGGTVAANATGRFLGDLNASYDDKYYNRQYGENQQNYGRALSENQQGYGRAVSENTLGYGRGLGENTLAYERATGERANYQNNLSNLLNLARGAQSQVTSAEMSGAGNTSQALMNQGNTLANIYGNQGRTLADISMFQGQNAANFGRGMDNIVPNAVKTVASIYSMGRGGGS